MAGLTHTVSESKVMVWRVLIEAEFTNHLDRATNPLRDDLSTKVGSCTEWCSYR